MSLVLNIALITFFVLAASFALAVVVGKAIKRHQADTTQFGNDPADSDRDNDRDHLGENR